MHFRMLRRCKQIRPARSLPSVCEDLNMHCESPRLLETSDSRMTPLRRPSPFAIGPQPPTCRDQPPNLCRTAEMRGGQKAVKLSQPSALRWTRPCHRALLVLGSITPAASLLWTSRQPHAPALTKLLRLLMYIERTATTTSCPYFRLRARLQRTLTNFPALRAQLPVLAHLKHAHDFYKQLTQRMVAGAPVGSSAAGGLRLLRSR